MSVTGGKDRRVEVFAILLMAVSLFSLLSLATYNPAEEPTISEQVAIRNVMGILGVYISHYLIKFTLGYMSVVIPVLGVVWGVWLLLRREHGPIWRLTWYGLMLALLAAVATGLPMASRVIAGNADFTASGLIGGIGAKVLHDFLGMAGAVIVLLAGFFLIVSGYLRWEVRGYLTRRLRLTEVGFTVWRDKQRKASADVKSRSYISKKQTDTDRARRSRRRPADKAEDDPRQPRQARKKGPGRYHFPGVDLLTEPPAIDDTQPRDDLLATADALENALTTFKVDGKVVRISPGPIVTLFEVEPGEGVRVNKFTVLADDLARVLSAESIRIIAPIAGTKHIGIEIPNERPATVYLRSIIPSGAYTGSTAPLMVALGKTSTGEAFCLDLARMPHLLIAGTTGSGKSVAINAIITSLLYRAKPDEVKFILIDPKKLELSSYRALEGYHLMATPGLGEYVITTPRNAVAALKAVLREMDRRYALFTEVAVRNIEEYQEKASGDRQLEKVPYIVVVVDELADLMITSRKEVEEPITRLAQMARAVGIHMIIATQRPSVDVITGLIKANFPARIAFQVASKVDSRTILDQMGAEKLLGRGDMLFLPPGVADPIRLHAAFITLEEILDILGHIQRQPQPPVEIFLPEDPGAGGENEIAIAGGTDALFDDAVRLVISHRQASVSMLQRRFRIGYSRAGRLIDELENAGVISGYSGSKAREVLVDESFLVSLDSGSGGEGTPGP